MATHELYETKRNRVIDPLLEELRDRLCRDAGSASL